MAGFCFTCSTHSDNFLCTGVDSYSTSFKEVEYDSTSHILCIGKLHFFLHYYARVQQLLFTLADIYFHLKYPHIHHFSTAEHSPTIVSPSTNAYLLTLNGWWVYSPPVCSSRSRWSHRLRGSGFVPRAGNPLQIKAWLIDFSSQSSRPTKLDHYSCAPVSIYVYLNYSAFSGTHCHNKTAILHYLPLVLSKGGGGVKSALLWFLASFVLFPTSSTFRTAIGWAKKNRDIRGSKSRDSTTIQMVWTYRLATTTLLDATAPTLNVHDAISRRSTDSISAYLKQLFSM